MIRNWRRAPSKSGASTTGSCARPEAPALALAFALGVGGYALQPGLPPSWPLLLLLFATGVLILARPASRRLTLPLLAITLGLGHAHLAHRALHCSPLLLDTLGPDPVVVGHIQGLPTALANGQRFVLKTASVEQDGQPVAFVARLRLSWYGQVPEGLEPGARWRLRVRLRPRHGMLNPGGFDFERWLYARRIVATGYVRQDVNNRQLSGFQVAAGPDRLRAAWRARLAEALPNPTQAGLARALVLGDRDGLTPEHWRVLTRTGTNHLIAISGLHVGLVAGFAFALARWLWSRFASLTRRIAAPRAAALAALLAALAYSALAGFAIPTQRALAMLATLLLAVWAGRVVRPFAGLALALAAVLLLDPLAVLDGGFWLSFAAVTALLLALGGRLGAGTAPLRWGQAQWAVAVGLLPLLLLLFGRAAPLAPLVNLLVIPLFTLLLPGLLVAALLALLWHWDWPLQLGGQVLELGFAALAWVADWPWAAVTLGERPAWVWAVAFLGSLLLLAPRGLPGRWLGLLLLLPLALQSPSPPPPGAVAFTLLDVGQGLSAVVRTARHTLIYDVGPASPGGFSAGSAAVAPYLRARGVSAVDLALISHADLDHAGGLPGLVAELPVWRILSGEPARLAARLGLDADSIAPCQAGQRWQWDGVEFLVLHPPPGRNWSSNDRSCVLQVRAGESRLLLTGDIGARVEASLARALGAELRADLLVVPHHGSASSSSLALLRAVQPRLALYPLGFRNRYGFPAAPVRARMAQLGIAELTTANSGAMEFLLHPDGRQEPPRLARRQRRLWRHCPDCAPPPSCVPPALVTTVTD